MNLLIYIFSVCPVYAQSQHQNEHLYIQTPAPDALWSSGTAFSFFIFARTILEHVGIKTVIVSWLGSFSFYIQGNSSVAHLLNVEEARSRLDQFSEALQRLCWSDVTESIVDFVDRIRRRDQCHHPALFPYDRCRGVCVCVWWGC